MISVRKKILTVLGAIILLLVAICEIIVSTYFKNTLIEHSIENEKLKMMQLTDSIDNYCSEITNFAVTIAVDGKVQSLVSNYNSMTDLEKIRMMRELMRNVTNRSFLYKWLGIALVIKDDVYYFNGASVVDKKYYTEKIKEDWYLRDAKSSYFSKPYMSYNTSSTKEIKSISFVLPVYNIKQYKNVAAYFIYILSYDEFVNTINTEVLKSMDDFYCVNSNNEIILKSVTTGYDVLSNFNPDKTYTDTNVIEDNNEIVILKSCSKSDWTIINHMSKEKFYRPINRTMVLFSLLFAAAVLLIVFCIFPVMNRIISPVLKLSKTMKGVVSSKNLDVNIDIKTNDEFGELADCFNQMMRELKLYINESVEHERVKADIEFALLISQVNPHFIYNCLNSVIMLIHKKRMEDAAKMTDSLIRVLQNSIKIGEGRTVDSVRNEIEIVKKYLLIQEIRYRDIFTVEWDIDDDILDCQIPKLIIQPIVENAILHGIIPSGRRCAIRVSLFKSEKDMHIKISDNGIGFDADVLDRIQCGLSLPEEARQSTSIGLNNIKKRINFLFGEPYGIKIMSTEGDTTILIWLPLLK